MASDLTTIQSDIQLIKPTKAPIDNAKLVTLTKLLLRSNNKYKSTILMLQGIKDVTYGQAVLMLKQAKERISGRSRITTETVIVAQNRADRALLVRSHPQSAPASRPSRGRDFSRQGRFDCP